MPSASISWSPNTTQRINAFPLDRFEGKKLILRDNRPMRSKSRECAFKILFSKQFHDGADDAFRRGIYKAFELSDEACGYAEKLCGLVFAHEAELVEEINRYAIGFSDKRMFPADRSLLLIAMAEMRYCPDVPSVVAIDEAVGLAKKYSTEKSVGFINGILASFYAGEEAKNEQDH